MPAVVATEAWVRRVRLRSFRNSNPRLFWNIFFIKRLWDAYQKETYLYRFCTRYFLNNGLTGCFEKHILSQRQEGGGLFGCSCLVEQCVEGCPGLFGR